MTRQTLIGGGVVSALAVLFMANAGGYEMRLMSLAGIYTIAVLGYQMALGHAGVLSLAQGAFFGVGAYVTGILTTQHNLDGAAAMLAAMLVAAVLAALVAIPVLRLKTHYFALATLAIAEVVHLLAVNWTTVTGGANGIYGVPPLVLFSIEIASGWPLLVTVWSAVALAAGLVFWRTSGRRGLRLDLARETPLAADVVGINRRRQRFELFVLSAILAAVAGSFQAHAIGVVSPAVTDFALMVTILVATLVGGQQRILGAVIGGILVIHLPEWFRAFDVFYLIAYGAALLLVIIVAPKGIAGFWPRRHLQETHAAQPPPALCCRQASLHCANLRKHFGGVKAVDGITARFTTGQITGVIGPNGSGKSTLLNLLTGLIRADGGTITLDHKEVTSLSADTRARAGLARAFQHPDLVREHRVWEAVMAAIPLSKDSVQAAKDAAAACAHVDLQGQAATLVEHLSPEGLRRLEIARALATVPDILLLDEPAAGLTAAEQDRLAVTVRRLADDGLAIIVVEHGMRFLLPLADTIICLDQGQVIATGPAAEIAENPEVIDCYLGRFEEAAKEAGK